ncbi:MAG: ABC transporter ATP-binding protein [Clostridia bacterium]|nr:ABC transporter ATP-binding protein [Clostridia bacterium]
MAKKQEKAKRGTLGKVLRYIGRYKLLLPVSILLALVTVALTLYIPMIIGDIIDIIGSGYVDMPAIAEKLGTAAILIGLTALAQWLMSTINNRVAYHVVRDMRNDAFRRMSSLPLSYIDTHPHGDTVNRVINDADQFTEGLLLGFTQLFTGVLTIIGTLAFMIYINWIVAIVVVVLTPMSLFIAKFIASRTHSMFKERSEREAEATSLIGEMIGNQKLVKAFSYEDEACERFADANGRLGRATLDAIFYSSLVNPTTRFINSVVYAAVALTGALLAIGSLGAEAAFTIGELSCLLAYTNQYTKPFNEISGVIAEFQNALACASRVFDLIEAEPEVSDAGAGLLGRAEGRVELEDVHFSYTPEKPLIEGLSLSVKPGERIAIVGPTGCGKTTLINLLMRFYDVKSGSIRVEGEDIREVTRHSLRSNYGMVLQDTWLAHGTVRDNIVMGKPDATEEEIVAAAKAAHAHSFIKRLKDGYDTVIGEGGEGLSQGQKQLLCITRIMLALPPILILDEATSSIDTRTEIRIQKAFAELMQGRTSFIVAHRLSTIKEADVILVMKDGNIVEQGKHGELVRRGGFYAHLYKSQFPTEVTE